MALRGVPGVGWDAVDSDRWRPAARSLGALAVLVAAGAALGTVVEAARPVVAEQQLTAALGVLVARSPFALAVLREVTGLGGPAAVGVVPAVLAVALLRCGDRRLAGWVAVTGTGAVVLGPAVTAVLLAVGVSAGFPDGYAFGSTVAYGAVLLVLRQGVRWRRAATAAVVVLVVVIGGTRLAIGGYLLGDVVGGWLLGVGWLAATTAAMGARYDSLLVTGGRSEPAPARPARYPAVLAAVWLLLLGALIAAGRVVIGSAPGSPVDRLDTAVLGWFVAIRSPLLTAVADVASSIGDTPTIVAGTLTVAAVVLVATRRGRPVIFLAVVIVGELGIYLGTGALVDRPRPSVSHLGLLLPPTSSFPSGHVSAAISFYGAAAVLATMGTRAWWRWCVGAAAVLAATLVALGRLYYGVHYPTDVLASVLFAVPWLAACRHLMPPAVGASARFAPRRS
ncbi:phosphatase PAP2 family protein [Pseudonocardia saturnea]